jgi:hypothetical protein
MSLIAAWDAEAFKVGHLECPIIREHLGRLLGIAKREGIVVFQKLSGVFHREVS